MLCDLRWIYYCTITNTAFVPPIISGNYHGMGEFSTLMFLTIGVGQEIDVMTAAVYFSVCLYLDEPRTHGACLSSI